jgi:hypothetical protein
MNKKYIVPCTESQVVFSHMIMQTASPVVPNNGTTPISDETTDYID